MTPPVGTDTGPEPGTGTNAASLDPWTLDPIALPDAGGGAAALAEVRAARHEGFDRMVFEFTDGIPGYRIEYIDRPVRQCGSGRAVTVAGAALLQVRLSTARAHTGAGEPTITDRERTPGLPVVRELELTCDFEGVVTWVLGVAARNGYRAFTLEDPARLVVDVRNESR